MSNITVAAKDCPADLRNTADVKLDGDTDFRIFTDLVKESNLHVTVLPGNLNFNGGRARDGSGYLRPAQGVTIQGDPLNTFFRANDTMMRISVETTGVTLAGFKLMGHANIQCLGTANGTTMDGVTVNHSINGKYLDMRSDGATAAFHFQTKAGQVLSDITIKNCQAIMAFHHGFSMHTIGAEEGGLFKNFTFDTCLARACGAGYLTPQDWATGYDLSDSGSLQKLRVLNCIAELSLQSGFHCDGDWEGHKQDIIDVLYQDCISRSNGWRCDPSMKEKYRAGYYMQSGTFINCESSNNYTGWAIKNEKDSSLVVKGCSDDGSKYGMILEYGAPGAFVEFTSMYAQVKAFQGNCTHGTLDLTVINPVQQKSILFGRTQVSNFFDCPNHDAEVKNKYNPITYDLTASDITIRSPVSCLVGKNNCEVWGGSRADMSKVKTLLYVEAPVSTEPPVIVAPAEGRTTPLPDPTGGITLRAKTITVKYEDGSTEDFDAVGV